MSCDSTKPQRSRRRRWLYRVAGLVALVIGALALRTWWLSNQINAELARIRTAGEPVRADDLEAMYQHPPAEQDATKRWLDAIASLDGADYEATLGRLPIVGDRDEPPLPGQPWPNREAAERFVRQHARSLRLLHEAAQMGGAARYAVCFSDGWAMDLPHLSLLRSASRLLRLEAAVHAHRGDSSRAAASFDTLFALVRSLENEPNGASQLVALAIEESAVSHLERLLPCVDFSDREMIRLQHALWAVRYDNRLYRAMLGERVATIQFFEESGASGVVHLGSGEWVVTSRREYLSYLKSMREFLLAAKTPWPQSMRQAELLSEHGPKGQELALQDVSASNATNTLGLDVYPRWFATFAHGTAVNRAASAAIAVKRFQRRHGRLPESLDQVAPEFLPEVPTDPFDGKPLRYAVRNDEYVIYSVGADLTDDGGRGDGSGKPDVVFRVRRGK